MDDQFKPIKHKKNHDIKHDIKVEEIEEKEEIEVKHEEPEDKFNLNEDEDFKTPEAIAAVDTHTTAEPLLDRKEITKMRLINKKRFNFSLFKEKKVYIPLILVIFLVIIGVLFLTKNKPATKTITNINTHTVVKNTVASVLTGLQVNPNANKLPITAVMIENSLDARPQSGLSTAGVVFEAVAEGGVTRFMALYQNNDSTSLGPIRSARPYYVSWAMGFDADYVHVGGSPDALSDLSSWGTKNLDQFYNGDYFQRVTFRDAPHNVYSTLTDLTNLEQSKGYTSSNFTSWKRKAEKPSSKPTATKISFSLSGPDYDPIYTYNPKTNSYDRDQSGVAMTDANNGQQISPKVVIGIVVPVSQGALDASGAYYSDYQYIGSGNAYIYQDGTVTKGTWTKNSNSDQIIFTDLSGNQIPLDAGQVWITAVSDDNSVSSS